jgi:NADPH2:quinone reductase
MSTEAREAAVEFITDAARDGWLKHNIARTLPLESIAEAHELVETGGAGGRVILELA